jgi:intracellular sulfur oxidation DsrE/DsrF family protein
MSTTGNFGFRSKKFCQSGFCANFEYLLHIAHLLTILKLLIMKKNFFAIAILLLSTNFLSAQNADYRVLFDLTSKDSIDQKSVIRWINEIVPEHPDAKVEVVMFAQGTALALKDKSLVSEAVTKFSENKNISFKICAIAMKNQHIDASQLVPGVQIVPDGIYEIISKQREGWGYIKVSH